MVFKMAALSRGDGRPTYSTLSSRPGRKTAGSIMSEKIFKKLRIAMHVLHNRPITELIIVTMDL